MRHQQVAGCANDFALLANVHRLDGAGTTAAGLGPAVAGPGTSVAGTGAYFDDDQRGAVETDEIQFTQPATISPEQYLQALPLQIPGRALLPREPAFGRGGCLT